jgi:hypothetical protein
MIGATGAADHAALLPGGGERAPSPVMRALEGAEHQWLPPSASAVAREDVAGLASHGSPARDATAPTLDVTSPSAAVVGASARAVMPVAAAAAGELRVRARAGAALVVLWHPAAQAVEGTAPGTEDASSTSSAGPARAATPAGAATPAARRLEARLADDGAAPATACGRVAWLLLHSAPTGDGLSPCAAVAARVLALAGAPVVLAICGPRPAALEPLIAACDVAVAVLPADADPDLRTLALAALPTPRRTILPPLAPGPPRWAALAGLARLRSLPVLPVDGEAA